MSIDASAPVDRPRRGRRPGPSHTRQAILAAASARFATDGYAGATIRKIAADAGVDASLVMQSFGSKEELFAAVMSIAPTTLGWIARATDGPEDELGERLTRSFLEIWEGEPTTSEPMLAMLRGAITNQQAATQLCEFIETRLVTEVLPDLRDDPIAQTRVGLASSMLVGVIVGRQVVQVPTVLEPDTETLVKLIAPAIQALLIGESKP